MPNAGVSGTETQFDQRLFNKEKVSEPMAAGLVSAKPDVPFDIRL